MSSLHPHWKETDSHSDDALPSKKINIPVHGKSVSRLPAAIIGMIIVGVIGIVFLGGVENFRGQLLDSNIVTVQSHQLEPSTIHAKQGEEIIWESNDSLPHTFQSSTLCDENGACLDTDLFFEGESISYTIPTTIAAGSYEYSSTVNPDIKGVIIIEPSDSSASSNQAEEAPAIPAEEESLEEVPADNAVYVDDEKTSDDIDSFSEDADDISYIEELLSAVTQQDASEGLSLDDLGGNLEKNANGIEIDPIQDDSTAASNDSNNAIPEIHVDLPRNPYVVGSTTSYTPPSDNSFHSGAPEQYIPPIVTNHVPMQQPETGATFWIVLLSSIGGFFLLLYKRKKVQRLLL